MIHPVRAIIAQQANVESVGMDDMQPAMAPPYMLWCHCLPLQRVTISSGDWRNMERDMN